MTKEATYSRKKKKKKDVHASLCLNTRNEYFKTLLLQQRPVTERYVKGAAFCSPQTKMPTSYTPCTAS